MTFRRQPSTAAAIGHATRVLASTETRGAMSALLDRAMTVAHAMEERQRAVNCHGFEPRNPPR